MKQENYFLGSATIDLTNSRLEVFNAWRTNEVVMLIFTPTVETPLPDPAALSVIFLSRNGVPGGLEATDVVYADDLVMLTTQEE